MGWIWKEILLKYHIKSDHWSFNTNVVHVMQKIEIDSFKTHMKSDNLLHIYIYVEKFKHICVSINVLLWKVSFVETTVSLHCILTSNYNRIVFSFLIYLIFCKFRTFKQNYHSVIFQILNNLTPRLILKNWPRNLRGSSGL